MATVSGIQLDPFDRSISGGFNCAKIDASSSAQGIILCQLFLLAALVTLGVAYRAFDPAAELLIYPACLLFVGISVWCFWTGWRQTSQLLDPYLLFLLAAVLFNGGQAFLQVVNANDAGFLKNVFPPESLLRALFFTILGLTSVHLGALFVLRPRRGKERKGPCTQVDFMQARACTALGLLMIAASVLPWLLVVRESLTSVMTYGYFVGLFRQDSVTGFDAAPTLLGNFLVPGALFLLAGSGRERSGRICSVVIIIAYCSVHLFQGSRTPAMTALFATLWLWNRRVSPVGRIAVLLIGLTAVVLLPLVAAIRDLSMEARTATTAASSFKAMGNPAVATVAEMGNSLSTVAYTIELVPMVREFDLGKSYAYALVTVFPNLFWGIHPTSAHGLLAHWLIWTVDPGRAAVNGGLGYSFLAEAYLNFGWYGAPLALVGIGLLLGALSRWATGAASPGSLAALASLLTFVLFYARGESASVVRGAVWYALLPYAAFWMVTRSYRK